MKTSTMIAYSEVDTILSLMDKEYNDLIPKELRYIFKTQKSKDYNKVIDVKKPLTEQNISKEGLAILAFLNYEYWCKNKNEKDNFIKITLDNENKKEKELRKKYNPDNIFKKEQDNLEKISANNSNQLLVEKKDNDSIFSKLLKKIKSLLKK